MNDNISFETPFQHHVVVFKPFMTGREELEIKNVVRDELKVQVSGDTEVPLSLEPAVEKKTIETMIVSVDGDTEGVYDAVLDMARIDTDAVVAKMNSIINVTMVTEEKKSESSSDSSSPNGAAIPVTTA